MCPGNAFDIDASGQGWHTNIDSAPFGGDGTLYSLDISTGVSTAGGAPELCGLPLRRLWA
ncbi:MAG: hypothetical protein H6560_16125 [Lewinellaceae bacterium]|nr:hypothetical protein [Lewinellaceae bacterium]